MDCIAVCAAMLVLQSICFSMCGDVGFAEHLFQCNKCRFSFQHRYKYYYRKIRRIIYFHYFPKGISGEEVLDIQIDMILHSWMNFEDYKLINQIGFSYLKLSDDFWLRSSLYFDYSNQSFQIGPRNFWIHFILKKNIAGQPILAWLCL